MTVTCRHVPALPSKQPTPEIQSVVKYKEKVVSTIVIKM